MSEEKQVKININDTEYNMADLSDEAKAQVQNLKGTEIEIKRLNMQLAIAQTARNTYLKALQKALPKKKVN